MDNSSPTRLLHTDIIAQGELLRKSITSDTPNGTLAPDQISFWKLFLAQANHDWRDIYDNPCNSDGAVIETVTILTHVEELQELILDKPTKLLLWIQAGIEAENRGSNGNVQSTPGRDQSGHSLLTPGKIGTPSNKRALDIVNGELSPGVGEERLDLGSEEDQSPLGNPSPVSHPLPLDLSPIHAPGRSDDEGLDLERIPTFEEIVEQAEKVQNLVASRADGGWALSPAQITFWKGFLTRANEEWGRVYDHESYPDPQVIETVSFLGNHEELGELIFEQPVSLMLWIQAGLVADRANSSSFYSSGNTPGSRVRTPSAHALSVNRSLSAQKLPSSSSRSSTPYVMSVTSLIPATSNIAIKEERASDDEEAVGLVKPSPRRKLEFKSVPNVQNDAPSSSSKVNGEGGYEKSPEDGTQLERSSTPPAVPAASNEEKKKEVYTSFSSMSDKPGSNPPLSPYKDKEGEKEAVESLPLLSNRPKSNPNDPDIVQLRDPEVKGRKGDCECTIL